jgi:signal peptidase
VIVTLACLALIVPAVLLATGVLPYSIYAVSSGSMSPSIPLDSAVIVQKGVYNVGQVITFQTRDGVVTHRLLERRSDGTLVTKGDANETTDPGTVSPSNVIGGVIAAPPMVGRALTYLRTPLGLATLVLAMVVLWLLSSTVSTMVENRAQAGR